MYSDEYLDISQNNTNQSVILKKLARVYNTNNFHIGHSKNRMQLVAVSQ